MTDTAVRTDASAEAQRAVIAESGWGARFRVIQPRNFTFWVVAFLFVYGAPLTIKGFSAAADAYTESFAQGAAWFTVFALAFLWFFARLDRYSSIPAKAKVLVFLFTGLIATFAMAALNNDAFRSILTKLFGIDFQLDWGAGLTAPWSEEIAKMLAVVFMIGLAPKVMRCAFDGLIVGAISGLAFQVFEDVAYVYASAAGNFGQAEYGTTTLGLRTALGLSGHWTWSAVCGAGLIYLVGRPAEKPKRALGIALIASSMFLHWFWDSIAAVTGGAAWGIAVYLPLTITNLAIFIWVYRHTVVKERAWAGALLAPEVDRGTITAGELDAFAGTRKVRKHFVKSQPHHRRTKHVLEATGDLADEIARANAADTSDVEHARAEIARLRG